MAEIKFHIWHEGDRSVGIDGDACELTMNVYDDDHLRVVRESLTEAFTKIWDFKAHVMTDLEVNAGEDADA